MPSHVYKIRRNDGMYSAGGTPPRFTKSGKSWSTLGFVKLHLLNTASRVNNKLVRDRGLTAYQNCELIEYEVVERNPLSIKEIIKCLK